MSVAERWLTSLVFGPAGVRAGWRFLFFAALVLGLNRPVLPLER